MAGLLDNFDPRDYQSMRGGLLDPNRPVIRNPDGTISTERTITIDSDGKFYNIPTIVNGQQVAPEMAISLWKTGKNPHVGVFTSIPEAETAARARSQWLGKVYGN